MPDAEAQSQGAAREDLASQALEHYRRLSRGAGEWSSTVEIAILFWGASLTEYERLCDRNARTTFARPSYRDGDRGHSGPGRAFQDMIYDHVRAQSERIIDLTLRLEAMTCNRDAQRERAEKAEGVMTERTLIACRCSTGYVILIDGAAFEMSEDALMPDGVNMYVGEVDELDLSGDERVRLIDLPKDVLVAIIRRIVGIGRA
jgi:hypothetical protein